MIELAKVKLIMQEMNEQELYEKVGAGRLHLDMRHSSGIGFLRQCPMKNK